MYNISPAQTNFSPVLNKNPKNEPNAASKDSSKGFLFTRSSAIRAPINGPMIIPIGGRNTIPATIPAMEYLTANVDPPDNLVRYGWRT